MESGPGLESAQRQSKTSLSLQRDGVTSGKSWTLIGRTVVLALGRAAVTGAAVVVVVVLVARAAAVRLVARAVAAVTAVARPRRHQQAARPARTWRQSETKGVSSVRRRVVPGNWCLYKFCPPCNEGGDPFRTLARSRRGSLNVPDETLPRSRQCVGDDVFLRWCTARDMGSVCWLEMHEISEKRTSQP